MECMYIETLELDEFAAKYLPILEARDARLAQQAEDDFSDIDPAAIRESL